MGYNIDYLLRYVSMDTYNKIINSNNDYVLGLLSDNYIDVNLNIKYLINLLKKRRYFVKLRFRNFLYFIFKNIVF